MAKGIMDFTAALIMNKTAEPDKSPKKLKEAFNLNEDFIEDEEELDDPEEELDDPAGDAPAPEDGVEEVPEADEDEGATFENGGDFEESETNDVYFCTKCKKHFLATEDTPDSDIECPVCGEKEMLVEIGSAAEALEEEENKEVAVEIEDEVPEEEPVMDEEPPVEEELDEDGLEEAINLVAQKYLNEKARVRIRTAKVNEAGNLVLEGRVLPLKKDFKVVIEGFINHRKNSKFIAEATTDLFKSAKLKFAMVKEGNVFKVKKMGYGILTESMKYPVSGIVG